MIHSSAPSEPADGVRLPTQLLTCFADLGMRLCEKKKIQTHLLFKKGKNFANLGNDMCWEMMRRQRTGMSPGQGSQITQRTKNNTALNLKLLCQPRLAAWLTFEIRRTQTADFIAIAYVQAFPQATRNALHLFRTGSTTTPRPATFVSHTVFVFISHPVVKHHVHIRFPNINVRTDKYYN